MTSGHPPSTPADAALPFAESALACMPCGRLSLAATDEAGRLAALERTGLLDTPAEEAFDRLTRLAARLLQAPVALVSLIDEERQFFKSSSGLTGRLEGVRETPRAVSFCHHVVNLRTPLVIPDASAHPLVRESPLRHEFGVAAYLGIPIFAEGAHVLGSICVLDFTPRAWTPENIRTLTELAEIVMTEITLRGKVREQQAAFAALRASELRFREAEAHLLRAQRMESIGTLASGIAHDLNNMLSPILMSAELLRLQLPADAEGLISMIESSAERAALIVKQVLTFARGIEGERLPIQPRHLIREVSGIVTETFPRLIRFEGHIAAQLTLIEGDPTQLHQVLLNLCVNARDAMPDGGTLRIDADEFEVDENFASMTADAAVGRYLRLRVSDTGSGIPAHLVEKIFDPFFTTKPVGKGTGLGLSTALGIVRSHHGFIQVQSALGKGTTFEIFIPAAFEETPPEAPPERLPSAAGHGKLILVVDDESAIRDVTQSVLNQNGYRTLGAADGTEALSIFASQIDGIDAVFTDVMMPFVDGISLCRALRKMKPEVRIVAATGCDEESRLQELRGLSVRRVLAKPFSNSTLLSAISEALAPHSAGLS